MSQGACEHVLATDDKGHWSGWPFEALELPTVPPGLGAEASFSDDQKREAFGSALPLLAAYGTSLSDPPDQKGLFELLRARLSVRTREAVWDERRVGGSG